MQAVKCPISDYQAGLILSRWQKAAMSPYEQSVLKGASGTQERFADPMSYLMLENTAKIWQWLLQTHEDLDPVQFLEEICRLKAVQEPRPSKALSFIFALKQIIREELGYPNENGAEMIKDLEQRIDELALVAFDIYAEYRAKIYQLKIAEFQRMSGRDQG